MTVIRRAGHQSRDRDIQVSCSPQGFRSSELSSSHRACGVPAGERSDPRWQV